MRKLLVVLALLAPLAAHADPPRRAADVRAAKIIAGVGAVSLAAGVAVGLVAKQSYDQAIANGCVKEGTQTACGFQAVSATQRAIALGNVGTVFGSAGVVLLGAGVVVYLLAPRQRVVVAPVVTPTSAGAAVALRF